MVGLVVVEVVGEAAGVEAVDVEAVAVDVEVEGAGVEAVEGAVVSTL